MKVPVTGKRIVIVGATSSIAEHCARHWVNAGSLELILVGRDAGKLGRVADDLRVRSPQSGIRVLCSELLSPESIGALVEQIALDSAIDIVLIAHGCLPDQIACQKDIGYCHQMLTVNGLSPVLFAEAFAGHMERAGRGTLAVIGSVAGDRGRRSNYVYGAAKGLIERYVEGLQHRLADSGVRVVLIKPGPTDTPMTARLKGHGGRLAEVSGVALRIVRGIEQGRSVIYVPTKWWWIMWIVRHLPQRIFNRLDL